MTRDFIGRLMDFKVELNWGAKNSSATYRVAGKNLDDIAKVLSGREKWGKFEGTIKCKWQGDAKGNATLVRLTPAYTITMPVWPGYKAQPQACKDAWDTMWRALKKHEDGHTQIFTQGVSALVSTLEALRNAKGSEIDTLVGKASKAIQAQHDKFDRETDHGRSRGVELVFSDECKSKTKRGAKAKQKH
jgi:predicted secreted Zn-dependent protease